MNATHPSSLSRPTVVLLHASASSSRQWDELAATLRPAFDVHAIDLNGHGRQAPWGGERPLSMHDDAALAMPAIERSGGAHVIGHSYGGAVALHIATTHPTLVHSLALYEPVAMRLLAEREPQGAALREALLLAHRLAAQMEGGDVLAGAKLFVNYWSGPLAWGLLGSERQRSIVQRMPTVLQHFAALFGAPLHASALARLTMPVLCLRGSQTTVVALRIAGLLRELLPGARHEMLDGLGHMGPITHPSIVNGQLLDFLGVERPRLDPEELAAA